MAAQIAGQVQDKASTGQLITLTMMKDDAGNPMPPEMAAQYLRDSVVA